MGLFSIISAFLSGCSPANPSSTVAPVSNGAQHNQYFKEASELITPYMKIHDVRRQLPDSAKARRDVDRGIALLKAVVVYNPTNWAAWWVMGKGYQAVNETEKSCHAFGKSFEIQKANPDVAREYMFACLETGRTAEAISAAEHAIDISPDDAGLHANLALAYTLAGRIKDAQSAISRSLQIDPSDQISQTLNRRIQEIAQGKRPQPSSIRDLERKQ